jgi:hypothetical protein
MKHPLNKIFESGAEPINSTARNGMTNRPDAFGRFVERLDAEQLEIERQKDRLAKEYKNQYEKFIDQLSWWLRYYPDTGKTSLPFTLVDPTTKKTLLSCEEDASWSEVERDRPLQHIRHAFRDHPPTEKFPLIIMDAKKGIELAGPTTLLMKNAIYIFREPIGSDFRAAVRDVIRRQERL